MFCHSCGAKTDTRRTLQSHDIGKLDLPETSLFSESFTTLRHKKCPHCGRATKTVEVDLLKLRTYLLSLKKSIDDLRKENETLRNERRKVSDAVKLFLSLR